ncbi:MAG: antitoxin family protein [Dehalococcoidia bacterium]
MARSVTVVFDGEVFRPVEPVDLPPDTVYSIRIEEPATLRLHTGRSRSTSPSRGMSICRRTMQHRSTITCAERQSGELDCPFRRHRLLDRGCCRARPLHDRAVSLSRDLMVSSSRPKRSSSR